MDSNESKLADEKVRAYLEHLRWPNGALCPACSVTNVTKITGKRVGLYQCRPCRKQFTVTVGTIFEGSHIPLTKWIQAFQLMCASKKGISSLQLSRMLGITYKSAWFMSHRIRHAMKRRQPTLAGVVEVDETYVGGKTRYRHESEGGRSLKQKVPVVALVERQGRSVTKVVNAVSAKNLKSAIRETVMRSSTIMTDDWPSYRGIGKEFKGGHHTTQHGRGEYVRGETHTNTVESFFALLKRGVMGSFHHVSRQHLQRYCDEFSFRWDARKLTDVERTIEALRLAEWKRLRYRSLINGKATNGHQEAKN